ncbi:FAS1 domain-containing protein [Gyrodon lividus]|nr:FAS1 domain-containing protein [Gyrodon lividus]
MRLANLAPLTLLCGAYALPVVTLPWFGQIPLDGLIEYWDYFQNSEEERTIYQVLKEDSEYSRLVKAIDLSDRVVDLLNDPSKSVTFFAVPNSALPHPRKPRDGDDDNLIPPRGGDPRDIAHELGGLVLQAEELDSESDSRDKEKRKETIGRIVRGILAYHILPEKYEAADLVQNSTYATNLTLKDGSMDYQPLRLSVSRASVPPRLRINTFVEVTKKDIEAKNGVIHQINHPLLPPPSVFQETFLVPEVFSYFTTAIQRVGLTGAIDRWHFSGDDGKKGGFLGATATTVFAPTSGAFQRLPKKLKLFLFSPFGEKALRKLLEYHIVPNFVLHSDYSHKATSNESEIARFFDDVTRAQLHAGGADIPFPEDVAGSPFTVKPLPLPEPVYEYNVTLPTLLEDHDLRVQVARYKSKLPLPGPSRYFTRFKVNGRDVGPFDIPARNGALHVISTLLDPRKGHDHHGRHGRHGHHGHHEHDGEDDDNVWDDWEEWLPQWAIEN